MPSTTFAFKQSPWCWKHARQGPFCIIMGKQLTTCKYIQGALFSCAFHTSVIDAGRRLVHPSQSPHSTSSLPQNSHTWPSTNSTSFTPSCQLTPVLPPCLPAGILLLHILVQSLPAVSCLAAVQPGHQHPSPPRLPQPFTSSPSDSTVLNCFTPSSWCSQRICFSFLASLFSPSLYVWLQRRKLLTFLILFGRLLPPPSFWMGNNSQVFYALFRHKLSPSEYFLFLFWYILS